jgi:hypothetical protein
MIIRNEKATDIAAITEVTIAAFKNLPISNHTEQFIIHALREKRDVHEIITFSSASRRIPPTPQTPFFHYAHTASIDSSDDWRLNGRNCFGPHDWKDHL